jgi:hypothetical protein
MTLTQLQELLQQDANDALNFERLKTAILDLKENPPSTAKVYRALLSQNGTDNPVVTILENTLGAAVVWTYDAVGSYLGTCTGVFTVNKTAIHTGQNYGNLGNEVTYAYPNDVDTVYIETIDDKVSANDILNNTFVEILVYP